ncbi:MAG: molybdopterin molybdenumtransferase MoeA, partial [Thermodesulfobacteriota bacterium]
MAVDGLKDMLGRAALTPVKEARAILLESLAPITRRSELCPLVDGLDRVLSENILSPEDLPAHPRSTMDGFAVQAADTFGASGSMPCYLEIDGEVAMGEMPEGEVR